MKSIWITLLSILAVISFRGEAAPLILNRAYPTAEPCCCNHFFFSANYICWKAHEDNLQYAFDGLTTVTHIGSVKELDWEWSSGFQVGAGFASCSGWDLFVNYTWYKTHADAFSNRVSEDVLLFPTFAFDVLPSSILSAESDWNLRYQTIDVEIGNLLRLNPQFSFRPHFGLRGAFTRDNDRIVYMSESSGSLNIQTYRFTQKFNGIGPRVGLNALWSFFPNLSLFGEGALALVWGDYHLRFLELTDITTIANNVDNLNDVRLLTDVKIGLNWDTCLFNCFRANFFVAWEHRLWLKHNQYQRFTIAPTSTFRNNDGDLSLYGVNVGASIYF